MSQLAASAASLAPRRGPLAGVSRHLEIAASRAQKRARPRLAYAVIVVGGIVGILLAQLMLSIIVADGAYQISSLQVQQRDLSRQQQDLGEQLEVLASTQNLTANAEALGMVASGNPVFLDLATGAVTGTPSPSGGSLVGQTNLIGNSLLTGSSVLDPVALAAAQAAADAAATAMSTEDPNAGSSIGGDAAVVGGQPTNPVATTPGAPPAANSPGSVASPPGTIPSPVTH